MSIVQKHRNQMAIEEHLEAGEHFRLARHHRERAISLVMNNLKVSEASRLMRTKYPWDECAIELQADLNRLLGIPDEVGVPPDEEVYFGEPDSKLK